MSAPNPSLATQNPTAADWSAARGDKWLSALSGMEATLAPIDPPLIEALALPAGPARVADIACGGGGTTLAIAARVAAGSVVHGYDIAPMLIDAARARAQTDGARGDVTFSVANVATALPDAPYDRLASRFGTMFFDDPPAAFANVARWLVPGGRFAFAVWAPLGDNPWMATVRDVVSRIVTVPANDPNGPGPFRYADAAKLTALLADSGLVDIAVRDVRPTLTVAGGLSADAAARFALASFASFGELVAAAGEAAAREAEAALTERFAAHVEDGQVRLGARVHVIVGRRA